MILTLMVTASTLIGGSLARIMASAVFHRKCHLHYFYTLMLKYVCMGKMGFAPTVVLNGFVSPALELLLMKRSTLSNQ